MPDREKPIRESLAFKYIHGNGIEIGALHEPLVVPDSAKVRYIDRFRVAELRNHYPELSRYDLVEPDIVDDGETLKKIPDASQDFVIANHFIEHCEDPIGTVENFIRVIRSYGIIYIALPDKRHTFDKDRPITPISHIIRDHEEGPAWSREGHFEEFASLAAHQGPTYAKYLRDIGYSIHYHVWTKKEMLELMHYLEKILHLSIEEVQDNGTEVIFILKK